MTTVKPKKSRSAVGRGSRRKGGVGEREAINKVLQPIIDDVCQVLRVERIEIQRNLLQAHRGGCDVHGLDWLSLEVKRDEGMSVAAMWQQTCEQAARTKAVPVLLYRRNGARTWNAVLWSWLPHSLDGRTGEWVRSTVDIEAFATWFRARLISELQKGIAK
jgi:hypothetical protein